MAIKRNRRAGVEDLWWKSVTVNGETEKVETKLHGKGKRWRGRYVDAQGDEHTKRFARKVDANDWVEEFTVEHATGTWVDPKRKATAFSVVAEQWYATKATKAPTTIAGYRSLLDTQVLPRWGDTALADINYEDVQIWVTGLSKSGKVTKDGTKPLSPSRTIQAYQVLDQVLRYSIRAKRLAFNPASDIELPRKADPDKRYLSHEQIRRLAAECGRFHTMVLVLAYCGLRYGEAIALRGKNVDLKTSRIRVQTSVTRVTGIGLVEGPTKNHAARSVPIPKFVVDELRDRLEGSDPDDLVFPSRKDGWLPLGEFRWVFDTAAKKVGLDGLVPHELRHTAASLAIAAGANVKVVQQLLGHKTATLTLDRYGHLFADDLDTVAAALDAAAEASSKSSAYPLRTHDGFEGRPALRVVR
ncbi:site-specific integrase [Rhodococcus qingshengii]|uniref:tyrosine-type recombinase/integrase n=1 Tax=Rhodococcus TaxID=1827 RepID=UPI0009780E8D|nr:MULTISPECIES: site-specific integrase [Rhodococcus]AUS33415.1 site-specific integrase [Rhodococcus qingshengii]MCC4305824.1 site-specific integrase [Rhodococcus sp. 3-2]